MSAKKRYDVAFKKDIAQIYLDGQRTAPSLQFVFILFAVLLHRFSDPRVKQVQIKQETVSSSRATMFRLRSTASTSQVWQHFQPNRQWCLTTVSSAA